MVCRSRKCFPEDMLTEVLCRVPVESLIRCSFVCKTWHQLITSTFFIKTHLQYQKTSSSSTNNYILHDQTEFYTLLTSYESIFRGTELPKLYYTPRSFGTDFALGHWGLGIYGICDGLLCVSDKAYHIGDYIYLWNPFCRKAKKLPKIHFSINSDNVQTAYGGLSFGYYLDDYKVIAISPVDHTYIVSIYSLSTDCWKIIPTNLYFEDQTGGFLPYQPTKFVDGNAYMLTYNKLVVCFDLRDDTIRQFKLPEEFVKSEVTMEAYGETIALLGGSDQLDSRYLYLWILKDKFSSTSPWEMKLVIELQDVGLTHGVGFLSDNQYLVRTLIYEGDLNVTKFYLWDLKSPKLTEFRCQDGYPDFFSFIHTNCVESLLLLDENSLSPFVQMEMESTCSSTKFIVYNKDEGIPNDLLAGRKECLKKTATIA